MLKIRIICIFIFTSLMFASTAYADIHPLDCLTDAEGLYVRWNSSWQKDNRDNNNIYRLERITKVPAQLHYVLELQSESKAAIPTRRLSVKKSSVLPNFCNSLKEVPHKSTKDKNIDNHKALQKTLKQNIVAKKITSRSSRNIANNRIANNKDSNLPFIEFKNGRWVRADAPQNLATVTCNVLSRRFSCKSQQKEKYGSQLKALGTQITASQGLEY